MKLSDIINNIDIKDPQEFIDFTNKWIDFVVSKKQSKDISDDDWQNLFTRSNPVAGIDRGEMLDKAMIPTKNGKEERITNERNSFRNKWDSDIRPKIEDIINTKNESEKISKAKELSQLILQIIKDGGGRKMQVAINRILATFFPDLFVSIPNPNDLIKFIEILHKVVDDGTEIIKSDNWIDNCYQVKKFFDKELNDDNKTASAWRFYDYLKDEKSKVFNVTTENIKASTSMKKNEFEVFRKLLLGNYNLILTGAPGTGKTYLAKKIAEAIGANNDTIKMVQFHPSYDYTDFVEGLRPIKEGDSLGFQRKDGVFKEFCKAAINDSINTTNKQAIPIDETFRELWERIRNGDIITLKLFDGGDSLPMIIKTDNDNMIYFSKKESPKEISIGNEISLDKVKKTFEEYQINSVAKLKEAGPNRDKLGSGGNVSNLWAVMNYLLEHREKFVTYSSSISKKYVFIIDEINRGEISKIFGELFYSIDAGYRGIKGRVETQYQNLVPEDDVFSKGFYIPQNVYIIGTMNDIDRSVESMDFAMRRRFAWKEITAKSRQSMLDEDDAWGNEVKPSDNVIAEMKARMDNLNAAIIDQYQYGDESLSNKDKVGLSKAYQIGAAYFLKYALYNDFEELWTTHIEGLLYEYLRGKTNIEEKIERLHQAYNDTTKH